MKQPLLMKITLNETAFTDVKTTSKYSCHNFNFPRIIQGLFSQCIHENIKIVSTFHNFVKAKMYARFLCHIILKFIVFFTNGELLTKFVSERQKRHFISDRQ